MTSTAQVTCSNPEILRFAGTTFVENGYAWHLDTNDNDEVRKSVLQHTSVIHESTILNDSIILCVFKYNAYEPSVHAVTAHSTAHNSFWAVLSYDGIAAHDSLFISRQSHDNVNRLLVGQPTLNAAQVRSIVDLYLELRYPGIDGLYKLTSTEDAREYIGVDRISDGIANAIDSATEIDSTDSTRITLTVWDMFTARVHKLAFVYWKDANRFDLHEEQVGNLGEPRIRL